MSELFKRALLSAIVMFFGGAAIAPAQAHVSPSHSAPSIAPWQDASPWPDRIVATFEGEPSTSFAVTWRTDATVPAAIAEIALATPDARFDLASQSKAADTESLDLQNVRNLSEVFKMAWNEGLEPVHYHSIRFDGLKPDTLYAYRVSGASGKWSEWFQIRTAPVSGSFKFLYLGDAQNGILSHWSRTVRAAFQKAPDARFIIHAGDLVNRGSRDLEWAEWFKAVGFIHGMIPAIPVAGNHEYDSFGVAPSVRRLLSAMWRPQFRLDSVDTLPPELRETVYAVRYTKDLHVFVLDTTGASLDAQAAWLDAELTKTDAKWRVVTMHHPIYSSGEGRDNKPRRDILLPIFAKHKVDLILQGHDHTYARGTVAETGPQRPEREAAIDGENVAMMFVNSVSGPTQYKFKSTRWDEYAPSGVRLDRFAEGTQFFQVIDVNGDTIDYRAYAADGQLYDSFLMTKSADGSKRVTAGEKSTMEPRLYGPSNPYRDEDLP
jgi:3',5'-cyclic AMP phosphodiesterase CpdA